MGQTPGRSGELEWHFGNLPASSWMGCLTSGEGFLPLDLFIQSWLQPAGWKDGGIGDNLSSHG